MTRRNKPADPTAEDTADQNTQSASGLTGGRPTPEQERNDEHLTARRREDRRSKPEGETQDPALPADDSTLKTKI